MSSKIQLIIDADGRKAEATLASLQEEAQKAGVEVSKLDQVAAAQHIEKMEGKLHRNAEAARYFGGETAALEKEQQMLRREIERLIRQGMDPLDRTVVNLKSRYDSNQASLNRLTATKRSYTEATRRATRVAATFMRTLLPIASAAAAVGASTRFIRESGAAFEEAEAQAQKFAITYDGITEDAERRARELAATFGYAQSSMRGILAETGDILTGFGLAGEEALELTERATYLGAALAKMNPNIGDASAATQDLTKLMAGQAMSMQKWGVVVRDSAVQARLAEQGLQGLTGEALLQAQAQARLEIAYEQSINALANVSSETELALDVQRRYDEAWKERREIVGEAVTNFFTPIKSRIADHIASWNEATQAARNYHSVLTEGVGDFDAAVQEAEKQLESAKDWYEFLDQPGRRTGSIWGPDALEQAAQRIQREEDRLEFARQQQRKAEDEARRTPASQTGGSTSKMVEAYQRSSEELQSLTSEIDAQLVSINKLASAHEKAGIEFDAFAQKQGAVRKALVDLVNEGVINADHLDEFIDQYAHFLADVEEETQDLDLSSLTSELDDQLGSIDRLASAYGLAGEDFDAFSQKQHAVKRTFEELAEAGADSEYLQDYIDTYAEFFAVIEDGADAPRTVQEILSAVDETAFNAAQSAWRLGDESAIAASKIEVFEDALDQMRASGEYTEWQIYQMEQALKSFKDELEDTSALNAFELALGETFGSVLDDLISGLADGSFDVFDIAQQGVSSIFSSVSSLAMTAMPQFAPLIAMAEGAVQGLNRAIFGTVTASRDAQRAIDEQHEVVRDLFLDVLGLEEDLAKQRIDAIREQMDLLSDQHDLEMQILRDRWERGEISGEEYFSQAMAASSDHREAQANYDRQQSLIEGVRGAIEELEDELDDMSGWTKFWTSADTKLKTQISKYEQMLAAISAADGLSEDEIRDLARTYGVDIPGAARGADFITSGPMLMAVGENPGGREHVQVTPLSSPNYAGPQRNSEQTVVHINVVGDVYGIEDLHARLRAEEKRLQKLGRLPA